MAENNSAGLFVFISCLFLTWMNPRYTRLSRLSTQKRTVTFKAFAVCVRACGGVCVCVLIS